MTGLDARAQDEENAWVNTKLSAVIEVLAKCWESTEKAAANFGELGKVTLVGSDICIEDEWTSLVWDWGEGIPRGKTAFVEVHGRV